jgi:hypothetical protein
MWRHPPYRFLLPIVQTVAAIGFGGVGLWQRHVILSQQFWGDQTLWESTARFHVWPLPFRFAVVSNFPAFVAAGLLEWPLSTILPGMPEAVGFSLFVGCVPILWYCLGKGLDTTPKGRSWKILLSFATLSTAGIFTPGYTGYIFSGCLLWIGFAVWVSRAMPSPQRSE